MNLTNNRIIRAVISQKEFVYGGGGGGGGGGFTLMVKTNARYIQAGFGFVRFHCDFETALLKSRKDLYM